MPLSTTRAAERPSSLRDYAYRELRDAIVSGEPPAIAPTRA